MVKYNVASSFAKRVAIIAKLAGSGQELANRAQISRRVIGKYLAGESDPSRERLIAMAEAVGVSVEWLATGRGAMRGGDLPEPTAPKPRTKAADRTPVDYLVLSEALETVQAGVDMMRETQAEYATNELNGNARSAKDKFGAWIEEVWTTASDRDKILVEVQFEKTFPEFTSWLQTQLTAAS